MKTVKQCDYCPFVDKSESVVLTHEKECRLNPANEHCQTCKFYAEQGIMQDFDMCKEWVYNFPQIEMGLEKCDNYKPKDKK